MRTRSPFRLPDDMPLEHTWKFYAAFDLIVGLVFIAILALQGAPAWALTLAVYISTRPSRYSAAGDHEAVKSSITVLNTTVENLGPLDESRGEASRRASQ